MDHRLVETLIKILRSFSEAHKPERQSNTDQLSKSGSELQTSLGFNEIVRKTSKDRGYVKYARDLMIKRGLLRMEENGKTGKRQQIRLTPLGTDVLETLENVDRFNESNDNFLKYISELFEKLKTRLKDYPEEAANYATGDEKIWFLTALKNAGFSKEEAIQIVTNQYIHLFVTPSLEATFFLALLQSYMSIYYRYYNEITIETEDLLAEIILGQMHKQLKRVTHRPFYSLFGIEKYKTEIADGRMMASTSEHLFGSSIKQHFDSIWNGVFASYFDIPTSTMRGELRKSFISLLKIGKFSQKTVLDWGEESQKTIETVGELQSIYKTMKKKGEETRGYSHQESNIKNLKVMLKIYADYLNTKDSREH